MSLTLDGEQPKADVPSIRRGMSRVEVDGHLIVGHERIGRLLVLDPLDAEIMASLDGSVALADLADDLASALGTSSSHARLVLERKLATWQDAGVLDGPTDGPPIQRRLLVPPESCLGGSIGLGRATVVQVRSGGTAVRVASTIGEMLVDVVDGLTVEDVDDEVRECFVLRVSQPRTTPRVQRVHGPSGELLWFGTDPESASDVMARTIAGRLESDRAGAWTEGIGLVRDGRVVLVADGVAPPIALRRDLDARSIEVVRSGFLELRSDGHLYMPSSTSRPDQHRLELAGAICAGPDPTTPAEALRSFLDLAWSWNQPHLDLFGAVAARVPVSGSVVPDPLPMQVDRLLDLDRRDSNR